MKLEDLRPTLSPCFFLPDSSLIECFLDFSFIHEGRTLAF